MKKMNLKKTPDNITSNSLFQHIGMQLKLLRVKNKLSQLDLGKIIIDDWNKKNNGVSRQQVYKYETGISRLSCLQLYNLAKYFDVPISYFYEGYNKD